MSKTKFKFITKTFSNTNKEGIDEWLNLYRYDCEVVGYVPISGGCAVMITIRINIER